MDSSLADLGLSASALTRAMDGVDDAVAIFTAEDDPIGSRIVYVNDAMVRLTGYAYEQLLGHSARLLAGARPCMAHVRAANATLERATPFFAVTRKYRPDDSFYDVEVHIAPLVDDTGAITHYVATQRDVTERKRERAESEARIVMAERAASIGRLAASAAHEMAGPVSTLVADIEAALGALEGEGGHDAEGALRSALAAAHHLRGTVQRLRAVSDADDARFESLDVHDALELAVRLTSREITSRACLVRSYAHVPRVRGDAGRLALVFVNLLRNAAEAIPPSMPVANRIHLRTRRTSSGKVAIEIEDTGVGIEPDRVARVFDPFVTTKSAQHAFGLGLTVARAAVLELCGVIAVESTAGRGTRVRVVLPAEVAAVEEPLPFFFREELPARQVMAVASSLPSARELGRCFDGERTSVTLATFDEALEALALGEMPDVVICESDSGEAGQFLDRVRELVPEVLGRTFQIRSRREPSGVYRIDRTRGRAAARAAT